MWIVIWKTVGLAYLIIWWRVLLKMYLKQFLYTQYIITYKNYLNYAFRSHNQLSNVSLVCFKKYIKFVCVKNNPNSFDPIVMSQLSSYDLTADGSQNSQM